MSSQSVSTPSSVGNFVAVGEDELPVASAEDEGWPYDPKWVELAAPPLERLRRDAVDPPSIEPLQSPAAPT
jgi:hypothetical protein